MRATGHRGDARAIVTDLADGYAPVGWSGLERAPLLDWSVKTGNGSLYATAGDLLKWTRGFFGGAILSPDMMEAALATRLTDIDVGGLRSDLGYVWAVGEVQGRRRYQYIGRSPGFSAALLYYPDEQVTVAVLSNTYSLASASAANALAAMALGEPYQPVSVNADPLPAAAAARLVGEYRFGADAPVPNMSMSITETEGRLTIIPDFSGIAPSALIPDSDTRFIMRSYWQPLVFEAPPGEAATALTLFGARAERVR